MIEYLESHVKHIIRLNMLEMVLSSELKMVMIAKPSEMYIFYVKFDMSTFRG